MLVLVLLCCSFHTSVVWGQKRSISSTDEAVYEKIPKRSLRKKEEKNKEISNSNKQYNKVSRGKLGKKRDKSKEINNGDKVQKSVSRRWLRRRELKNEELNSGKKGESSVSRRTLRKEEIKSNELNSSNKVQKSVSRRWLRRKEIKNKELSDGDKIQAKVSRKWLRREEIKSQQLSDGDKLETKVSRNKLRQPEIKSHEISDYKAGYTETKAERRERRKRFFIPGDYSPKTPQEKKALARDNAKKAYEYSGDIIVKRKTKDLHPSAEYLNSRSKSSYEKKERYRKRMLRKSRSGKKEDPKYMREKGKKPRYDDVEKGLWND